MKISEKIRQNRQRAGMTQEQLANKIGVSAQAVSKWENGVSMPDICLLPNLAEVFGVSIDELFDLTVEHKLNRIENRLDIDESFSDELFNEYKTFIEERLYFPEDRERALSLLANLYHKRMESDSKIVSKYARESILLHPEKKDCQWLLSKAEGHVAWDWNIANHSTAIEFYKKVIDGDHINPKSPLPFYFLIDNLIADNRYDEVEKYLEILRTLPAHKPVLIDFYRAYVALGRHNLSLADEIINEAETKYVNDGDFLFEAAQYYAKIAQYDKAVIYYERYWTAKKPPRFTDALYGIAIIAKRQNNKEMAVSAYERILKCLIDEWGYTKNDNPYIEAEREMLDILK